MKSSIALSLLIY